MIICVKTEVVVGIGMVMVTGVAMVTGEIIVTGVVTGVAIATVDNGIADVVAGNDLIA